MASKLDEIEKMIHQLSIKERAILAHHLIETLDDGESDIDEDKIEQLWIKEAKRRSQEIKNGMVTYPADEVMREARAYLK